MSGFISIFNNYTKIVIDIIYDTLGIKVKLLINYSQKITLEIYAGKANKIYPPQKPINLFKITKKAGLKRSKSPT